MSEESALVPISQKEVVFYGDTLVAVMVQIDQEPEIYIPVRPISDALGLDWSGQYQRINRDDVLSEEVRLIRIESDSARGGRPEHICLPLEFIPGWLFGIQASRVKPELRDKIILFRRECYKVLSEAFQEGRLTSEPAFSELIQTDSPAVRAYRMAVAITEMARNQVIMEARLDKHEERLELIESQLGDESRTISQAQAVQISQAVKAIALVWSKETGRNEYGAVYGRLYQEFEITSYKLLPAHRFREAMKWLTDWYVELTGNKDIPF
jgi:hypothetical protein